MAKESTKVRRIKATEAEVVKEPKAKKAKKDDLKRKIRLQKPKFKKTEAPQWLKTIGKPFAIVFGPAGRYIKGSFGELKSVKWPNRKAAWVLTLAVVVFSVFFAALILAIDQLFDLVLKNVLL